MRGVSGVALAVAMPLVGIGQQPGWVQDVPWIQTASLDVHSWSAGETFALQQQTLLPEHGAVALGYTQIGTFSRLAVCAGTQVKLTPQVAAQLRSTTQMVGRGWPRLSVPIGRPYWKSATIC